MKNLIFLVISVFCLFGCKEKEKVHIIPQNPIDTVKRTVIDSFAGNYYCYYMHTSRTHIDEPAPTAGTFYDTSESGYTQIIIKKQSDSTFRVNGAGDYIATLVFDLQPDHTYGSEFELYIRYFSKEDSLYISDRDYMGGGGGYTEYQSFYMGRKKR